MKKADGTGCLPVGVLSRLQAEPQKDASLAPMIPDIAIAAFQKRCGTFDGESGKAASRQAADDGETSVENHFRETCGCIV